MTLFALSGLLIMISSLLFGIFVFSEDKRNKSYQFWLVFNLAVATWGIGAYKIGVTSAGEGEVAISLWRLTHIGIILIPIFFTKFIHAWLGIKRVGYSYFLYAFGAIFSIINLYDLFVSQTGLFIIDVRWVFDSFYYDSPPGSLYLIFTLIWVFIVLYAHYELFKAHKKTRGIKRLQIKYFIIAFIVAYAGGATSYLPVFGIDFYPYFNFAIPIYTAVMSYAILKLHFLNVKIIVVQLLTFGVWVATAVQFFLVETLQDKIIQGLLLIFVLVFGMLIIKNIQKEIEQREEIEKLAKTLREANARLRELDRMKSEFVSFATHQIRAPITAIKGYTSLILEGSYGEISSDVKEAIHRIHKSSNSLAIVVEDYLDISRIEMGKMKYDFKVVDFGKLVLEVVKELTPSIKKDKLELLINIDKGKEYEAKIDKEKMKQVITNIIDNAIKYTEKGSIEISVYKDKQKDKLVAKISDTGVGIKKATIPKLFKKFSRAKDANETNIHGTGLGLYIAKVMTEAHKGGKIRVESEGDKKGSQFYVEVDGVK
jgi:signal transduction histidine kinase